MIKRLRLYRAAVILAHALVGWAYCGAIIGVVFLLGVFSLMEGMLGRPISEIVSEIALPDVVRAALLGRPNQYRQILDLVTALEAGNWIEVGERLVNSRQDEQQVAAAYLAAVDWAQKVFQV